MVGFVNFHGAPGVNDTNTDRAVELGWTVFDSDQKRGYATETAVALMAWASEERAGAVFLNDFSRVHNDHAVGDT